MEEGKRTPGHIDCEYEMTAEREDIAAVFDGLVDGLLTGTIRLGDSQDAVSVGVSDEISLALELEPENDGACLEIELEWSTPEEAPSKSVETKPEKTEKAPPIVTAADTSQSLARFELFCDRAEEWRWRLRHNNGHIIAVSGEGDTQKHIAYNGLQSVIENSPTTETKEVPTNQ